MKEEEVIRIKDRLEKIGEHLKNQDDLGPDLSAQFDEIRQKLEKAVELHDQGQYNALGEDLRIFEGSIEVYLEEIPDAGKTAKEWLTEAQRHEGIGEPKKAKEAYEKYFTFKEPFLDPYMNYIDVLRSVEDDEKIRIKKYRVVMEAADSPPAAQMAYAFLLEGEEKLQHLRQFVDEHEDYLPAYLVLIQHITLLRAELTTKYKDKEYMKREVPLLKLFISYFEKALALKPKPDRVSFDKHFVNSKNIDMMTFGIWGNVSDILQVYQGSYVAGKECLRMCEAMP